MRSVSNRRAVPADAWSRTILGAGVRSIQKELHARHADVVVGVAVTVTVPVSVEPASV